MRHAHSCMVSLAVAIALIVAASSARAVCAPWQTTFIAGPTSSAGAAPADLVARDIDGDGVLDLVVAHSLASGSDPSGISVLHGNGNGTFTRINAVPVTRRPFGLVLEDFDRDGHLDLAVSRVDTTVVNTYRGDGAGGFTLLQILPMGYNPRRIAAGDFNHDGVADLVAADSAGYIGLLTVRLGVGDGTFGPAVTYRLGTFSDDVAIGDVNQDGHLDLVATEHSGHSIALLLGRGDGTFQNRTRVALPAVEPACITVRDGNGDGRLDLWIGMQGTAGVWFMAGHGDGSFEAATQVAPGSVGQIVVDDFDAEYSGGPEFAYTQPLSYMLQIRSTLATTPIVTIGSTATGPFPTGLAIGDFNGDDLTDFVISNNGGATVSTALGSCGPRDAYSNDLTVHDVPNDEGGKVALTWTRHLLDGGGMSSPVRFYGVSAYGADKKWHGIAAVPGTGASSYSYIANTTQDSVGSQNPLSYYCITASWVGGHSTSPAVGGYSVDNLAPPAPENLTAFAEAGVTIVDWTPSAAPDVAYYNVYASLPGGAPQLDSAPITSVPGPPYTYPLDAARLFQVAAVDIHGNMGPMAATTTTYPTPVDASLASWRATPTGVELEWLVDARGVTSATLERGDGDATWTVVASGTPDPNGRLVLADDAVAPGSSVLYRLAFTTSEGTFHSTPATILVPALALALEGARPNPARGATLALAFTLRTGASASLELYDVAGRRVLAREVGAFGPGRHVLDLRDAHLAGGVYLARLTQGGEQRQARLVVL